MWPGIRPATGWIAYSTSTPFFSSWSASSRTACWACATAIPYPGTITTFCAYEHDRDVLARSPSGRCPRSRPSRPAPACTCPKAPKSTLPIERFIARPISIVSSVPDAPTSAPLTISTFEPSSNPVAAAASPVKAFSSEITTGMSAPPIGSTKSTPKTSAPQISATRIHWCSAPATIATPAARMAPIRMRLTNCWPGIRDRPPADQLLQLREGDQRARERDRADQRRERDRDGDVGVQPARVRGEDVELGERDERRRAAADAVEERHHLRHRGHLHLARADRPEGPRRSDPDRRCASRRAPRDSRA